jgi:predicted NBD/HSP70 family sugar kinase
MKPANLLGRSAAETDHTIVDLVRSGGVVSRIDLAEQSGLTGASISRIVKRLLDERLLVEVGQGDPTGGKRRTMLALNTRGRYAVGMSVDEAHLTYVLVNLTGQVVNHLVSPGIGLAEPRSAVGRMAQEITDLLRGQGIDSTKDVTGIGVAIAGRLDSGDHPLATSREATQWEHFAVELQPSLEQALGLPVTLEHDYVCAALGEFWVGRVPATANLACFYAATGFGCGIVLGGNVYRGTSSNAGEIGHVVLDVNGPPCWCGSRGCLEALAGPRSVVHQARNQPGLAERLNLSGDPEHTRADFAAVAAAAATGDDQCLPIIEESARHVSAAILSFANVMDLDRVVLSGPAFAEAGAVYLGAAATAAERLFFLRQVHPVTVELSQLGLKSAAIGAATVALRGSLTKATVARVTALPVSIGASVGQ